MQFGPRYADPDGSDAQRAREAPPSEATLTWVVEHVGADQVVSVEPLTGGISSAMHRVTVRSGDRAERVVLRRDVFGDGQAIAAHEAVTLRVAAGLGVPTPRFLAADVHAERTDVPAVLMTHLVGRTEWRPQEPEAYLAAIARVAAEVHALPIDDEQRAALRPYGRYEPSSTEPPRWAEHPAVWARALELFHGEPGDAHTFIHRDLHPGNVLWHDGAVSGLVDWQSACLGPPSIDIGHCRLNLFAYEPGWADVLVAAWERESGRSYDPWADVLAIIGLLGDLSEQPPPRTVRTTLEGVLGRAVAALAG